MQNRNANNGAPLNAATQRLMGPGCGPMGGGLKGGLKGDPKGAAKFTASAALILLSWGAWAQTPSGGLQMRAGGEWLWPQVQARVSLSTGALGLLNVSLGKADLARPQQPVLQGAATGLSAYSLVAQPYLGLGYSSPEHWSPVLSLTADFGWAAQRPGATGSLGRAWLGSQPWDAAFKDMRWTPQLQVGVRYSF